LHEEGAQPYAFEHDFSGPPHEAIVRLEVLAMPRVSTPIRSALAASSTSNRPLLHLLRCKSTGALLKHALAAFLILMVAGCAGGGCASSCACAGITPLTNGFKPAARVENAGSARITKSGIGFLQQNVAVLAKRLLGGTQGGPITFVVPKLSSLGATACPDGANPNGNPPTCTAELDIDNTKLVISPEGPHQIHVQGPLPIRLRDLPIEFLFMTSHATLTGNDSCPGGSQTFASIDVNVDLDVAVDQNPNHTRFGYTRLKVTLNLDENKLQSSLKFCNSNLTSAILTLFKGLITDQIISNVRGQIDQQLCQKAAPVCPSGTTNVKGICRYGTAETAECASIVVGADGHIDLGGFLASISPSTKGGLDFLFAAGGQSPRDDGSGYAWGDVNPKGGGATLGMYGGAEPTPLSKCVKLSDMPLPTEIPIPAELIDDAVPNWPAGVPGPHLGLAISERFANYALNGVYNSGLLCIGISTDTIPQINSGLLGLIVKSLKDLGIQQEAQQVALSIRPSSPPKITFGNGTNLESDPLLRIKLNQAAFDFYVFSLDRYIRFMTATFDLDVPVNLTVTPEGLEPVLEKIGVSNGKITNAELLRDNPDQIATFIGELLASQVGDAVSGGIKPIDLNSMLASLGIQLIIPETADGKGSPGLRKLSKGANDNYLGIFAAFELASAAPPVAPVDTNVALMDKTVDKAGLKLASIRPDNAPELRLSVGSSEDFGTRSMEYSYRINQGFWHPFTSERSLSIRDGSMRVQGKHLIQVRARIAGEPMSLDPTPAEIEVTIDAEPPTIEISKVDDGKVSLLIRDLVSPEESELVRVKLDQGRFSDWTSASQQKSVEVGDADEITVEAKDEEGNLATSTQALRGRVDAGACGCAVVGADETKGHALVLLGVAAAFAIARRRRPVRRALGSALAMAFASSWAGCNCGVETTPGPTSSAGSSGSEMAVDPCPGCTKLEAGLVGAYTSVAVSGKTLWVAGYSEADYDNDYFYGDLVVGKWDGTRVDWTSVDGVPSEPPVDPAAFDVTSFRGGQTEAGDDVGTWTSIAIDGSGNPAVAYLDRTHRALKFAQFDGNAWTVSTVEGKDGADIGRYAKLLAQGGGFVIAYQSIEAGGDNGALISKVRVAGTSSGKPGPSDWSFEDAAVDKTTPCRAAFCSPGTVCVASTKLCTATLADDKCKTLCASGSACVAVQGNPACAPTISESRIDAYPEAIGGYISIAAATTGGIGIAYYDRPKGNLMIADKTSGNWTTRVVDGADATGKDTGDMGIGASLFIDGNGDWHIAYVDGLSEALRYIKVKGGITPGASEVIDDGTGIGGQPFDDGQHLVGDDASLSLSPSGEVRVSYQDATAGKLHYAVGVPGSSAHTWTVKAIDQNGFAGAFSHVVELDGKLALVNWWRAGRAKVQGDIAVVSP
jgi:MYXO-CTERM domain-containing protein